jgi:alpha-L-rhamnosidase
VDRFSGPPRLVRVEILGGDPFGDGDGPTLSWWLPDGAESQQWYRIRTDDGYDSGRIDSATQSFVPVPGFDRSRRSTSGRVQVGTDLGESRWSAPVLLETGLRRESDWTAQWIGAPETDAEQSRTDRPAVWLRTEFDLAADGDPVVTHARLHLTALGLYEAYLNGARVGDLELTPGFTQYRDRVTAQAHAVEALLHPGRNVLAVLLADGWFRGRVGMPRARDQFGPSTALRAQLEIRSADGRWTAATTTGPDWLAGPSHLPAADLIAGQREDRRLVDDAVHRPAGVDGRTGWHRARPRAVQVRVVGPVAPPVRRVQEIRPVSVSRRSVDGPPVHLVDLGRNINGWVRLADLGPAGTVTVLRHGEHLDVTGDLTTAHLDVVLPIVPEPLPLGQIDAVTSAGRPGDVFEPRFTTHGFRYVRLEGHPGPLSADDLTGVVVHSDLRRAGWFDCDVERLNRLHDAVVWSMRDNMCAIPTDCPQRERAGWTGDWQVFAPTAAYLYDVLGFTRSWLRDVVLDQRADGCVANISPCPPAEGFDGPLGALNGSAGWGDLIVATPWDLYQAYGDASLLRESWPAARRWLDFAVGRAAGARHPDRIARRPHPAPHEEYLWDSGFHWGEWLEPGAVIDDFGRFAGADKAEVATAYLARSAGTAAAVAEVLGEPDAVVEHYREIADRARAAWVAEFVDDDGRLAVRTQASHVRALSFGLVPDAFRGDVAADLVDLVGAAGDHPATGFLSTGLLLPTLADAGHPNVAYRLLLQDSGPSWLTMNDRGATTVWEHWNGIDEHGIAHDSLNHYSKGAVISFLHRYVAGLQPTSPGYRTFRVCPIPGGGLARARTRHDGPFGTIEVAWTLRGKDFTLDVTVPGGSRAEVLLPGSPLAAGAAVGPGRHRFTAAV